MKPQLDFVRESDEKVTLVGTDLEGKFRTAQAKEYPPSMCKALALGMMAEMEKHFSNRRNEKPGEDLSHENLWKIFREWYFPFHPNSEETSMHADYGPGQGRERGKREDSKFDKRNEADRLGIQLLDEDADISDEEALKPLKS